MTEIKEFKDLPEYGKYVLVYGVDNQSYGSYEFYVCEMNDLEDGMDFRSNGEFFWLTECGKKIVDVTHWGELPKKPLSVKFETSWPIKK